MTDASAASAQVARRHPAIEQDTMFDVELVTVAKARKKYVKPHSFDVCPSCKAEKVGRELRNGTLTWKPHHRHTIAGAPVLCSRSDTAVEVAA